MGTGDKNLTLVCGEKEIGLKPSFSRRANTTSPSPAAQPPHPSPLNLPPPCTAQDISSVLCDRLEGWDREGGRETQEGGDMGICVCL